MAQLVVAAAGAAIGGAIGGPAGARIGWMIGSIAGAALFAEKQEGPKIEDGKFSSSIYGQPIPLNYGTMRHATQLAWWSGLIIRTEDVGGKGGGGAEVKKARMNLLLAVCEGPQAAVLRIWANGRLIATFDGIGYDVDEEVLPAGEVRVYLGTSTQVADPTYEAAVGTENAVPYRGTVMIAIDGLEGDAFGNRPPNVECEVAGEIEPVACPVDPIHATGAQQAGLYVQGYGFSNRTSSAAYDAATSTYYIVTEGTDGSVRQIEAYDVSGAAPVLSRVIDLEKWGIATDNIFVAGIGFDPENGLLRVSAGYTWAGSIVGAPTEYIWDGEILHESAAKLTNDSWGDFPVSGQTASNGARHGIQYAIYPSSPAGGSVLRGEVGWWSHTSSIIGFRLARLVNGSQGGADEYAWFQQSDFSRYTRTSDVIYIPKRSGVWNGGGFNLAIRWEENAIYLDNEGAVSLLPWDGAGGYSLSMSRSLVYAPRRKKVYIVADGLAVGVGSINIDATQVYALTVDGPIQPWPAEITNNPNFSVWNEAGDCLVVGRTVGAGLVYWTIDPDTMTVLTGPCSYDEDRRVVAAKDLGDGRFACILEDTGEVGSGPDAVAIIDVPVGGATGQPITLQEIVEDLCERSGLPAGNLDASAGTDLVSGFKVARQTSARAAIESLRPAYFFDMPEVGEQIVLTKRGAASVATIDSGELGASIFQVTRTDPEPAYELEHVEEQEIPRRLELTYVDAGADYDPGVQMAERQVGESSAPLQIEVPVSLTAEQAARIAWVNLMLAHASKHKLRIKLSHAYDALIPSNCIDVPHASGDTLRMRIDQITRARPLLEVDGVLDEQSVYTFQIGGVPRYQGPRQSGIGAVGSSLLAMLDVPPLRDQDDALLRYVALGPSEKGKAWGGAALYKSVDGGTSFGSVLTTTSPVTLGATVGKLGDWTGGNVWDDENTVDVALSSGTFSSATDLAVLNGANAIAVAAGDDWEIVQFTTAELVGTDTWRLSRLLRGRRGTERCIDGHATGDRVVLLSTASLRVAYEQYAEIGVERHYKAVTSGGAVSDAASVPRTLAANSLKPLSPVHISGARDESNNLTISWVRRARIAAEWIDARDVALDEPTEAYEIDIYDGTSIVRTIEASTPTAIYSAAEQTADGLTPGDPVVCAIYQISSRIGRGHAGEATV